MTERQHNSQLLSNKLSDLPVPDGTELWQKIESQLVAVPAPQPPAHGNGLLRQGAGKMLSTKMTVAGISAGIGLLVLAAAWFFYPASRTTRPRPATNTRQVRADTGKNREPVKTPAPARPMNQPATAPSTRRPVVVQPAPTDAPSTPATLPPGRRPVYLSRTDSLLAPARSPQHLAADTIRLPQPATSPKEDEYYFDIRKRKKDTTGH